MHPIPSLLLRAVLGALGTAVTVLPRSWELKLGPALGRLGLRLDRKRREIALGNIRRCLPELGPAGWDRLLRENFEHYGLLTLELLHMFSPFPGHYRRYAGSAAVLENVENWRRARDKGRGVLFVSAHLANWELMAAVGAMGGVPLTIVTRHLKPEWLHRRLLAQRRSVDFGCFYRRPGRACPSSASRSTRSPPWGRSRSARAPRSSPSISAATRPGRSAWSSSPSSTSARRARTPRPRRRS